MGNSEVCNGCGFEMPEDFGNIGYDRRDFTLRFEKGSVYEDGNTGNREGWDVPYLCDPCVVRLRALVESAGFKVVEFDDTW